MSRKEKIEEEVKYRVFLENNKWFGYRICFNCKNEIKHSSIKKSILLRTIRNLDNRLAFCSSCNKKGKLNHFFGKSHKANSKLKISKNRTGKACGNENSMFKEKNRSKISISLKERYANGSLDFLKEIQKNNAITNQANGKLKNAPVSSAEKEIKLKLESLGYEIESQFNIGSLKYDLLIKDKNILIEYNGDYWHCNPKKYQSDYFHKKKGLLAKEIWQNDLKKKIIAEENGYKLFIIWEADYMFNKEFEINEIIKNL